MVIHTCPVLVAGEGSFSNKDTNGKWVPYRKYSNIYNDWNIPADISLEALEMVSRPLF